MNNIKPYTTYKPSGIAWLGDIPEHWEILSFKNILTERNEKNDPIRSTERLSLSIEKGVTLYSEKTTNLDRFKDDFTQYKLAYKDDLVFNSMNMIVGAVGVSKYFGCVSPIYYTYQGSHNHPNSTKYYEYLFRNRIVQSFLYSLGKGLIAIDRGEGKYNTLRLKISRDDLRSMKLAFPKITEQTTIAAFLDYKTAKVNRFIRKKKQLIKLLNEQKAGIINYAVTKGLDANAKMKPSGIEWLGDIPANWEIVKLTAMCDIVRGNTSFRKDELLNIGKYVALQYGKTYKVNEVDENYEFYVNDEFYKVSQIVNNGDIIFISTSETIQDLGHSVFYNRSDIGLIGGEQILLKPKNDIVNGKYLYYSSKVFSTELRKFATGVKVYRFNVNDLKTIYLSVPPLPEQTAIVVHIEKETAIINKTIATIEKEIALVQEYRTALIAEAVTGKIDVRDFIIPSYETVNEELEEDEWSIAAEDEIAYNTENIE